jgi:predicted transcriptional regulator
MTVHLPPEDQSIIDRLANRSEAEVRTPEQIIHDALKLYEQQESWWEDNHQRIQQKIDLGVAEIEAGQGQSLEASRANLEEMKAGWRASRAK